MFSFDYQHYTGEYWWCSLPCGRGLTLIDRENQLVWCVTLRIVGVFVLTQPVHRGVYLSNVSTGGPGTQAMGLIRS